QVHRNAAQHQKQPRPERRSVAPHTVAFARTLRLAPLPPGDDGERETETQELQTGSAEEVRGDLAEPAQARPVRLVLARMPVDLEIEEVPHRQQERQRQEQCTPALPPPRLAE